MKKLIASAVAAAVIPASVFAGGPTLYGKLHMSVTHADNDAAYKSISVVSNSSRIGVKGSEDLGNGLKAKYLIEWGVGMDGSTDLNQRNRGVMLEGGFGTVALARWDTPMKKLGRKFDLFGDRLGDVRQLTRAGSNIDNRHNNVIAYFTPNMSGFKVALAYVNDITTAAPDDDDQSAFSANAMYKNGPLHLGLGYSKMMADSLAEEESDWRLAGAYKFGSAKVLATYTDVSDGKGTKGNDYDVWTLGASMKFGSNTAKIQYGSKSDTGSGADDGADLIAVGLDHKLSKRSTVYVEYANLDNDKGSNIAFTSKTGSGLKAAAGGAGSSADGISVGIIHKF